MSGNRLVSIVGRNCTTMLTEPCPSGSMGQPQADTMGLPGLSGLWILGRKYMTGVRGVMEMRFLAV